MSVYWCVRMCGFGCIHVYARASANALHEEMKNKNNCKDLYHKPAEKFCPVCRAHLLIIACPIILSKEVHCFSVYVFCIYHPYATQL